VAEYLEAKMALEEKAEVAEALGDTYEQPPDPRDAITWLPAWQQQQVGQQMVMACVALPSCMEHIKINKPSPQQYAMRSGLALPGMS
jgi:hypothetical protein